MIHLVTLWCLRPVIGKRYDHVVPQLSDQARASCSFQRDMQLLAEAELPVLPKRNRLRRKMKKRKKIVVTNSMHTKGACTDAVQSSLLVRAQQTQRSPFFCALAFSSMLRRHRVAAPINSLADACKYAQPQPASSCLAVQSSTTPLKKFLRLSCYLRRSKAIFVHVKFSRNRWSQRLQGVADTDLLASTHCTS